MIQLPQAFMQRMQQRLGPEAPAFFACYDQPPRRGLRVNTLRLSVADFLKISPVSLEPGDILPEGFLLPPDAPSLGNHPYHLAGMFYLQEPSAMAPIGALAVEPGMRVLDLCAAPGGKSGGIAARLGGEGLLVANEVVPGRAKTLRFTLERLGVANAVVTCARPDALCGALPGYFHRVLVDAPCSGEGMFRKDPEAVAAWSPQHVASCAKRQQAILDSAAQAVASEGLLVYSTCTFSQEENQGVVEDFLKRHPDFQLESAETLYPHRVKGEGHFVARLRRIGLSGQGKPMGELDLPQCKDTAFAAFCKDTFSALPPGKPAQLPDGRVLLLSQPLPKGLERVHMLTAGIYAGDLLRGRFQPSHALAMAAGLSWVRRVELQGEDLVRYLAGETLGIDASLAGWCRVETAGCPLGLGKGVNGTLKNHLSKGLRLR